jgi:large conductance mechanosensitive channel
MKDMITGFKAFLLRGNLIEVAVAFVMALAFKDVIDSLITNLFTPLISMIFGKPDLSYLNFKINDSVFDYGIFLNSLIQFVAIAAALYFFVVMPYTQITERMKRGEAEEGATTKTCPECISTIPLEARRCPNCTSQLVA